MKSCFFFATFALVLCVTGADRRISKDWKKHAIRGGTHRAVNPYGYILEPSIVEPVNGVSDGSVTVTLQSSNVTNKAISRFIFGANGANKDGTYNNLNYTIIRSGGNAQTRFNYKNNAYNSGNDWYFITNPTNDWRGDYDAVINSGNPYVNLWVQIPAMGWVGKEPSKSWSFSQTKYGAQKASECTGSGNASWCQKDAGNGVWTNNSNVVGNDPNDASATISTSDAKGWVTELLARYGQKSKWFSIDNEPTLWSSTHRDVHPQGATYDEIGKSLNDYGTSIKQACGGDCLVFGFSPWGWCGYFASGKDHQSGGCTDGSDRQAHGNMPLTAWYLQQAANLEKSQGMRILDGIDLHFYPQESNVAFSEDESSQTAALRLASTRGLWDWSYVDQSWINQPIALIPRVQQWIDQYYPGTKITISEYNFGADDLVTGAIAQAEVLAIFATYGVYSGHRWTKGKPGSVVEDGYNIFLNYDGRGSSVVSVANDFTTSAIMMTTSNVVSVTSYAFMRSNDESLFVMLFNKDDSDTSVTVNLGSSSGYNTNGVINLYGFDKNKRLSNVGTVSNKPSSTSFSVSMPAWSVRLAVITK